MFLSSTLKKKHHFKQEHRHKKKKTDVSPGKELKLFNLWQKRLFNKIDIQDQWTKCVVKSYLWGEDNLYLTNIACGGKKATTTWKGSWPWGGNNPSSSPSLWGVFVPCHLQVPIKYTMKTRHGRIYFAFNQPTAAVRIFYLKRTQSRAVLIIL